ncbi:MAG: dephospho-CoA kinase [Candidatus Baltobacteraceae bacterium]
MRVGLTGGIGSGKSEVARLLQELGAFIIDTDRLAREAVCPGSDALREIARAWPGVVRNDNLDRPALADIVFRDAGARERLNGIVHPHVRRLAAAQETYARPGQIVVHVVPLLFETGYDARTGANIVVIAPDDMRIRRVAKRDGWSEAQIRARMVSQIDPAQARGRATYVIENDGDLAHLKARTAEVYGALLLQTSKGPDETPGPFSS